MKLYQLKCPSCDAEIVLEENRNTCYCSYCGAHLVFDDEIKRIEIKYTDEAKIKEIESRERIINSQMKAEIAKQKSNNSAKMLKMLKPMLGTLITVALILGPYLMLTGWSSVEKKASDRQEKELGILVEEVLEHIENHEFDVARVKAQSIDYTENWSDEIDKKWDNTRKELLKQIDSAEKEWKKENRNKDTWWNPFD